MYYVQLYTGNSPVQLIRLVGFIVIDGQPHNILTTPTGRNSPPVNASSAGPLAENEVH